jgi:hypothetical protein
MATGVTTPCSLLSASHLLSSTQPVDTQPVDTQPVDTQPVDTQPVNTAGQAATIARSQSDLQAVG